MADRPQYGFATQFVVAGRDYTRQMLADLPSSQKTRQKFDHPVALGIQHPLQQRLQIHLIFFESLSQFCIGPR